MILGPRTRSQPCSISASWPVHTTRSSLRKNIASAQRAVRVPCLIVTWPRAVSRSGSLVPAGEKASRPSATSESSPCTARTWPVNTRWRRPSFLELRLELVGLDRERLAPIEGRARALLRLGLGAGRRGAHRARPLREAVDQRAGEAVDRAPEVLGARRFLDTGAPIAAPVAPSISFACTESRCRRAWCGRARSRPRPPRAPSSSLLRRSHRNAPAHRARSGRRRGRRPASRAAARRAPRARAPLAPPARPRTAATPTPSVCADTGAARQTSASTSALRSVTGPAPPRLRRSAESGSRGPNTRSRRRGSFRRSP